MDTDTRNQMILIKGKDQTDCVASFRFCNGMCEVIYVSTPNKTYRFQDRNVKVLSLQKTIDPDSVIVIAKGKKLNTVQAILDFGAYYRILFDEKLPLSFPKDDVELQPNCLADTKNKEVFRYFTETAEAVSLVTENGLNILRLQYSKISKVSDDTVLANYLDPQKSQTMSESPSTIIYPFGLNQSQKTAVEQALSSKISIIQGPPGTGKTQTILNIIANVVRDKKTVAVVSNNNSATHNIAEKLEKKGISFLTAFLGSLSNKQKFLADQSGIYPNMEEWELPPDERQQLEQEITALSQELNLMLTAKNRIARIEQELLQLNPEEHYFKEYYSTYHKEPIVNLDLFSSQKILELWLEFEHFIEQKKRLGLLQKLSIIFRFNRDAIKLFVNTPELVIPYLQNQFYLTKRRELENERQKLTLKLRQYAFDEKMNELTQKSFQLFKAELAAKYEWKNNRRRFESNDFRRNSDEFTHEYPVIQEILSDKLFSSIGCAVHVSLATLIRDYSQLTKEETRYARNLSTHVDFLMFYKMDKLPILAIEVDGTSFHRPGSQQSIRDEKKNRILEKCGIPLLRLRTDGSNEKEKIRAALKECETPAADH